MGPVVRSRRIIVQNLFDHKKLSAELVATQTGVPLNIISDMLDGDCNVELEYLIKLARIFRKHWTVFLLDHPIYDGIPNADLRQGSHKDRDLSHKTIDALDSAKEIIDIATALDLEFKLDLPESSTNSAEELATIYRKNSGITFADQLVINSPPEIYGTWVNYFQKLGIYVVKYRLDNTEIRAASFRHSERAIIIINSNDTYNGQVFSLFHELCHIDQNSTGYCDLSEGQGNNSESFCNSFASAFLVPNNHLKTQEEYKYLSSIKELEDDPVAELARKFKVSRLVIARRLLDNGVITNDQYLDAHENIISGFVPSAASGSGGNFYTTTIAQNSKLFIKQLFDAFYDKKIEYSSIASSLHIKIEQVKELKQRVDLRG